MKSYSTTAFAIAIKIWLPALCFHTLAGSFILCNHPDDFMVYALIGGVIGGFFSLPIFMLLWIVQYHLLRKGRSATFILKALLTIGITAAFGASYLFFYVGGMGSSRLSDRLLFFLAPACGAVAILINYQSIQAACRKRDEANLLFHHSDNTTEPTAQL